MNKTPEIAVSIILNDMDRTDYASYGYRSWMLQDMKRPYEVILTLFNERESHYRQLQDGCSQYCLPVIKAFSPPPFFGISAANNLGLHFAQGKYVFFANSDIIYPSHYLRTVLAELEIRNLYYATGSRINLSSEQTAALDSPTAYDQKRSFDFLVGQEGPMVPASILWRAGSPWMVLRHCAITIGGFDPAIACHEDADFEVRALHYTRRMGLQQCSWSIMDQYGYHLKHPSSELYALSNSAKDILEPRIAHLQQSPDSDSDVLGTRLDSLDDLLADMYRDCIPAYQHTKPSTLSHVAKRIYRATKTRLLSCLSKSERN